MAVVVVVEMQWPRDVPAADAADAAAAAADPAAADADARWCYLGL